MRRFLLDTTCKNGSALAAICTTGWFTSRSDFCWLIQSAKCSFGVTKVKGFWGYYLPFDVTLAFSAVYEIIEWLAAANVDPAAGLAFLGSQGDVWDAQKDMTMAGFGALLAMVIIALINLRYQVGFWEEMKASFMINVGDAPLGEQRLREMRSARK